MKKTFIAIFAGLMMTAVLSGCASTSSAGTDSVPASQQLRPAPGMEKMTVAIVVEDKRPTSYQGRYGSSNIERPENYFNNTINLTGYTMNYLSKAGLFKSVVAKPVKGCYTLKLVWKSAHLNINGWIPFVIRFQNHMTIDMILSAPDGKVLWTYPLNGHVVNTPSSFRVFSTHRCDLFQARVLDNLYPIAFSDMCMQLTNKLKK